MAAQLLTVLPTAADDPSHWTAMLMPNAGVLRPIPLPTLASKKLNASAWIVGGWGVPG